MDPQTQKILLQIASELIDWVATLLKKKKRESDPSKKSDSPPQNGS